MPLRNIKARYDHDTGFVHIRQFRRRWVGGRQRREHTGTLSVRRADLRTLCDKLHDYADELDRHDRGLTRPTGRASGSRGPTTLGGSTGSVLSPSVVNARG